MADPVNGNAGSNPISDFAQGFVGDARSKNASTARIVGDLTGAVVMGEVKGVRDIFEGIKSKDGRLLIGGLIQLIPIAGGAAKTLPGAAKKLADRVAKKGLSKTALQYSVVAQRTAQRAINDPAARKKLTQAAADAGQNALVKLVDRLEQMGSEGETPDVTANVHRSFVDARKAAFDGMGATPTKKWFDMHDQEGDKTVVVGRHELDGDLDSARGFRFMRPEAEDETGHLYWWNNPADKDPSFGMESFEASAKEFDKIMDAYLNRSKSFRDKS